MSQRRVRVLVIDDSPANRRALTQMLESEPHVEVVDRAADGVEGLEKAKRLEPDLITLDLEMPRLDGFGFLRLLKQVAWAPVIVVSSYAHKSDVFKALELGAFDFVAKPSKSSPMEAVRADLMAKVEAVRQMRPRPSPEAPKSGEPLVVAVGASTGGPQAVQELLGGLKRTEACVLIAQHMPAQFTKAFAERLERAWGQPVAEASGGERPVPGSAYVAPGGRHLRLHRSGPKLKLEVSDPVRSDKHVPSVDALFLSVAQAVGAAAHAVVLTGMGNDGAAGCTAIAKAGGVVWAESEQTATVAGMPTAAMKTGHVSFVLPRHELAVELGRSLRFPPKKPSSR